MPAWTYDHQPRIDGMTDDEFEADMQRRWSEIKAGRPPLRYPQYGRDARTERHAALQQETQAAETTQYLARLRSARREPVQRDDPETILVMPEAMQPPARHTTAAERRTRFALAAIAVLLVAVILGAALRGLRTWLTS